MERKPFRWFKYFNAKISDSFLDSFSGIPNTHFDNISININFKLEIIFLLIFIKFHTFFFFYFLLLNLEWNYIRLNGQKHFFNINLMKASWIYWLFQAYIDFIIKRSFRLYEFFIYFSLFLFLFFKVFWWNYDIYYGSKKTTFKSIYF